MTLVRRRIILFWAIGWMAAFILSYQVVFVAAFRFTPCSHDHVYESRGSSSSRIAERTHQMLLVASFPMAIFVENTRWDDAFFEQLIYTPYLLSIQHLVYGCLLGLWRSRKLMQKQANGGQASVGG